MAKNGKVYELGEEDKATAELVVEKLRELGISKVRTPYDIPLNDPPELFRQQAILTLAVCAAYSVDPVILGQSLIESAIHDPATHAILEYVRDALKGNVKSN